MLAQAGLQPREGNTVALTMVISLVAGNSVELLTRGFELELYGLHECAMVFSQLKYHYQILLMNRKSLILSLAGDDLAKRINFEDLSASHPVFQERRRKMSVVQKLACDEFELFRCLVKAAGAMQQLFTHFEREGLFKNVIEHVEKNVYENRFGIFATLPFPRFKTYDEYLVEKRALEAMEKAELLESMKAAFTEARGILQRLTATEDA